jgi:hypothetical protein
VQKNFVVNVAIARTVHNFQRRTGISSDDLARKIGIRRKDIFEKRVSVTDHNHHFTLRQLEKIQAITCDYTVNRLLDVLDKQKGKQPDPYCEEITKLLSAQMREASKRAK